MLFCDPIYLFCLLPVTGVMYWRAVAKGRCERTVPILLLGSAIFYCTWSWRFFLVLLGSAVVNYWVGQRCLRGNGGKVWLWFGVSFDLLLLGYFKYFNFFIENCNALLGTQWTFAKIILPLGISFYTFQQIAYVVDCYQHLAQPCCFSKYLLFVTFFPQLVAGPIVHYQEMVPQFGSQKTVDWDTMYHGLWVFLFGLFKKVVIADQLAFCVNAFWKDVSRLQFLGAWGASLGYTMQLYFDFSGYADMAIGSGLLFGIRLPENFNSPYQALNIQDFWRRWHMTLSAWLKRYVYIPLGGNRCSFARACTNLFLTFLIGGIWHGAAWTFVIWGALHGAAAALHRVWKKIGCSCTPALGWLLTFSFVNFAWIFFRAPNLPAARSLLQKMFSPPLSADLLNECLYTVLLKCIGPSSITTAIFFAMIISAAAIAWLMPNTKQLCRLLQPHLLLSIIFASILLYTTFLHLQMSTIDFLYWQF